MARDNTRASNSLRYAVYLDDGQDYSLWSAAVAASGIGESTNHITKTKSVSFCKTNASKTAAIIRSFSSFINLDEFSADGRVVSSVYFPNTPSTVENCKVYLFSTPSDWGAVLLSGTLTQGWNHLEGKCRDLDSYGGNGINWLSVSGTGFGVEAQNGTDTIDDILIDYIRLVIPVGVSDFSASADNVAGASSSGGSGGSSDISANMDAANTARTTSTDVLPVQHVGPDGQGQPSGADSSNPVYVELATSLASSFAQATHRSPIDFSVAYTSDVTITATAGFTVDDTTCRVVYILYRPSGGNWQSPLINGINSVSITASSDVITVVGAGTPFASGDEYWVGIQYQDKAYSSSEDALNTYVSNPINNVYDDASALIVSAQNLTGAWADLGSEVNCGGRNSVGVWLNLDVNDSEGVRFRALPKWENGGTDEYSFISSNVTVSGTYVEPHFYEFTDNSDQKVFVSIDIDNLIPYIQLQVMALTVGSTAGQIDSAHVTKGYK